MGNHSGWVPPKPTQIQVGFLVLFQILDGGKNACLGAITLKHISSPDAILWIQSDKKKLWLLTLLNKFWGTVWINQVTFSPEINPVCLHSYHMLKECIWKSHDELIYFLKRPGVRGAHVENGTVLPQLFFFPPSFRTRF